MRSRVLQVRCKHQGFTLIELLVVVAVIAVVSAGAVLSLPSADGRQLAQEATRMSVLLEAARAQSRASGLPIQLQVHDKGFRLVGAHVPQPASGSWLYPETSAQPQTLRLGPEPVIAAQSLQLLGRDGTRVTVSSDGVRPFEVQ